MDNNKKIIEIAGVKVEIDLSGAKIISSYKVGDCVKLLVKQYGDSFNIYPGIIAGFDDFSIMPSITVAYIDSSYSGDVIKFKNVNTASKDVELCPLQGYEFPHERTTMIDKFERAITAKEEELRDLKSKLEFFLKHFGKYFSNTESK